MQIKLNTQNISLYPAQEEFITRKVEHLASLADRLMDESAQVKIDITRIQARREEDTYEFKITFFVPSDTLRAEAHGDTIENALDEVVDKLKKQIEHYKAKIHRESKRKA